jgi:hypothetical protein
VGGNVRKAAERVHEITKSGQLAGHGFEFPVGDMRTVIKGCGWDA